MPALSEWLQIMLGEIARKREELERGRAEDERRTHENATEDRDAAQARGDQSTPPGQDASETARAEQPSAARAAQR